MSSPSCPRFSPLALAGVLAAAGGCSRRPASASAPSASASPPVVAVSTASASASASAAASAASPPPRFASVPFYPIAESSTGAGVIVLGARTFVVGGIAIAEILPDGAVRRDPAWLRGLRSGTYEHSTPTLAVYGSLPGAVVATMTATMGSGRGFTLPEVYRWSGDRWTVGPGPRRTATTGDGSWRYGAMTPWTGGRVLGVATCLDSISYEPSRTAKGQVISPHLELVAGPAAEVPAIEPLRWVHQLVGLPSGDLFVWTTDILRVGEDPRLDRYAGARHVETVALPKMVPGCSVADARFVQLAAVGPRALYLGWDLTCGERSRPTLARYDGERWSDIPLPPEALSNAHLRAAPDGALWLVAKVSDANGADPGLFRRVDERWERVAVPTTPALLGGPLPLYVDVVPRSKDDAIVTVTKSMIETSTSVVFSTRKPPGAPLVLPTAEEADAELADLSPMPLDEHCGSQARALLRELREGEPTPREREGWATTGDEPVVWRGKRYLSAGLRLDTGEPFAVVMAALKKRVGTPIAAFCRFYPRKLGP